MSIPPPDRVERPSYDDEGNGAGGNGAEGEGGRGRPAPGLGDVAASVLVALGDAWFLPYWRKQGRLARAWMRRDRAHRGGEPPVLLLPGVHESPRFLDPFAALALVHDRAPHVVTALGRNAFPIADTAELAADYLERHDLRDVLVLAHSKGGLIGKQLMVWERTAWRIRSMVAVATPFSGSVYALRAPGRALRDFSPADRTLIRLASNRRVNRRIISIYPALDPQIPGGSRLPDAHANIRLGTAGHWRVLADPALWALLRRELRSTMAPASEEAPASDEAPAGSG